MKHILFTALSFLLILSCDDKPSDKKILLDSGGKINDVSVVVSNEMWKGRVGEAIRGVLASPIYGLPQDEPIFNINQIPTNVFSGFVKKNRTILMVKMGKEPGITFNKNVYAQPQKVVTVSGKTKDDIIHLLSENGPKIIETFKNIEINEKQRLIKKALYNTKTLQEKLGLNIHFSSAYRIAKNDDSFFWIRRDINTGTLNLMIYELPLGTIKENDSVGVVNQIIKIRDSIGKAHIPGPVEGSYMVTENAYTPFHTKTILNNKPTLETKGMWNVENAFMAGPYINYAIEDKINNRWIIAEGFVFAPSVEKRNYVFELEAIIKSIKIE